VPKEVGGSRDLSGKWQISTAGGTQPVWRGDGKEILFLAPDGSMMSVAIEPGAPAFRPGVPKRLFPTRLNTGTGLRNYDVTADGQRFLLNEPVADADNVPITVIVNWPKLLPK
jgi:hypothetical protein